MHLESRRSQKKDGEFEILANFDGDDGTLQEVVKRIGQLSPEVKQLGACNATENGRHFCIQ